MKKAIHHLRQAGHHARRAGRHLSKATVVALEISGALAFFLFFVWLGLLWRLAQGPIELGDFVKTHLESAFHDQLPDFTFTVSRAQLIWGGKFKPFEFEVQDVNIARMDKTPVFALDRLRVQLSKRNLVFGRVVPRLVHLYGPELRVVRQEDGSFSLNVGEGGAGVVQGAPAPAAADTQDRAALVRGMLRQLQQGSGLGILDGLHEIDVSDASVRYEDRIENVSYVSTGSEITIERGDAGIVASAKIALKMGETQQAALQATVAYGWDARRTTARVDFTGVNPSLLAQQSDKLTQLRDINMPMSGSINLDLDPDFRPAALRFALDTDGGTFNMIGLYPAPVAIKHFYAKGNYDAPTGTGAIEQLTADIGGPQVQGKAQMSLENGVRVAKVSAELDNMPLDKVAAYWPPLLTPDPRWWVTTHLSKGTATKATLELEAAYDPANAASPVALRKLSGKIDYTGIKVDYFPPLAPVKDVTGSATYDAKSFNLDITGGKLDDMAVTKSAIHVTDLDKTGTDEHCKIDIAVALNGPLKTALKVLDAPPLKYPEMLGIKTSGIEGKSDVNVSFAFPIHHGLTLGEVKVKADAKLKDVEIPDMVAGLAVTGGPMDLTVDNTGLRVKGEGKLAGSALQFDWMKSFAPKAPVSNKVTATLPIDAATLLKFGLPKDFAPQGTMPATLTYAAAPDKTAKLELQGDLKTLAFAVPQAGYEKKAGVPGSVSLNVALKDGKPLRLSALDLKGPGAEVKGDADFAPGGTIKKASFQKLVLGSTDAALQVEGLGKDGYDIHVTGRQLDASPLFSDQAHANSDAEAAKPVTPMRVSLTVGRLVTGKDKALDNAKASFARNAWGRLDNLRLDALAGGKPLSVQYAPQGSGHALLFQADNAGQALMALGISNSIRGGRLTVYGQPRKQDGGPRDMAGMATLENFKLNDAPVLAKLLNAMSLSGMISLLNGEGLSFKKARVNFSWTDRGEPLQSQNQRMLKLSDGQTSGSSLGLTFEGNIDEWHNVYDLKGTIIPISDINKMLSIIPIIGTVLTGGGEGVIAATYTIKGPKDKPDVMVNPLSVLAPGILRKLFFEH